MWRCDGRYTDGATARQNPVGVELEAARLWIVSHEDGERKILESWSVASLLRVDGEASKGSLRLKPNESGKARLIIEDREFTAALIGMGPHLGGRSAARRWMVGIKFIAIGVLAAALLVIGVPYFSPWIAPLVPVSWERELRDAAGGMVLKAAPGGARYCAGLAGQQALRMLSGRLAQAAGGDLDIRVRVASRDTVNALALPAGEIVLFDGSIAFARTPDEVAGIVAHEIGHQLGRDPAQAIIRAIGIDPIVDLLTGGALLETLGQAAMQISPGRDAEREADKTARTILASAGIDGDGLARFIRRLEANPDGARVARNYLSAHAFLAAPDDGGAPPTLSPAAWQALSPTEWLALREICSKE